MSEAETTAEAQETPSGAAETQPGAAETKPSGPRGGRIALGAALVIALAAGGVAVWRNREAPPAAAPAPEAQPSVDDVIVKLEARLKTNPNDAEGWRMLGWSYYQTERYAEAATAMKRATVLDPKNPEYFSMLGEALVLASKDGDGVPPDAAAAFDAALALDPKEPRARYFRAVRLDLDGKHQAALDEWFALLEDSPADAPWVTDVREVIAAVGKKHDIDVAAKLAAIGPAPAANGFRTSGQDIATAGIPGPTRDQIQAATALPKGTQDQMIQGMVDGLETKLKANPNNAAGWIMLMRSRVQLGEQKKAAEALQGGLAAFRNDGATSRQLREAAATLGIQGG